MTIPFNRPFLAGRELEYIRQAVEAGHLSGDGPFTMQCHAWLQRQLGVSKALLTHSCTAALEMAAILADVGPGDEVIMPSFTFVSTANAFVLRGATPVFVDVRPDTFNLDERLVEEAVTDRTRVLVPVHYAGVSCDMQALMAIAGSHNLLVVEDAAQGLMSSYDDQPVGSIGHLAAFSFHETKNVISGEGGALAVRDDRLIPRAEIIREKGTNRNAFFRGQVDKYTWVDIGSSYLPSEVVGAFLLAQMEQAETLIARRLAMWERYHAAFADLESEGVVRRPIIPTRCVHNAHMYYLLLENLPVRQAVLSGLRRTGVGAVFHYVPLHSSPAGRRFGRAHGELPVTDDVSDRLIRLPLWIGLEDRLDEVIDQIRSILDRL